MSRRRVFALCISTVLPFMLCGPAESQSGKSEVKGAAILDHPCGKVAVKQMGLLHAGKFDEANKLSTKEMQDQWKAVPAKDRSTMSSMAKAMSETEEEFTAEIKLHGVLVVNDQVATLTVQKTIKDANGTSTSTTTQNFKLTGGECRVSR